MEMNVMQYGVYTPMYSNRRSTNEDRMQPVFVDFARSYLERSHRSPIQKSTYYQAITHFSAYQDACNTFFYIQNLDEECAENFVYFLQKEKNLMVSTVRGLLVRIKTLLHKAANSGYVINSSFLEVNVRDEEHRVVFLSCAEIKQIYEFEGLTKKEEEIRDYFVIGCLTALRFSDYSRLRSENFVDGMINIRTKKTGTHVLIPQHPFIKAILLKYNYNLPAPRSAQYFNRSLKFICKKIGINKPTAYERKIGTTLVSKIVPKYELISSHTARRSAATNMFLADIPTMRIMKITGHKSESAFVRYIGISHEENAAILATSPFFN